MPAPTFPPVEIGEDFNPLTVPAIMPKSVRRVNPDGTPTQAQLDHEQALQAWTRDNVANTNIRLNLVEGEFDNAYGAIITEATVREEDDGVLAEQITTAIARVDDISADAQVRIAAKATPTGATAAFGVYLTAGSTFTGFEMLALSGGGSAIGLTASKFLFVDSGTAQPILSYSSGKFTFTSDVEIVGNRVAIATTDFTLTDAGTFQQVISYTGGVFQLNSNIELNGSKISLSGDDFIFTDSGTDVQVFTYSSGTWTINANVKINGSVNINPGTVVTANVATSAITTSAGSTANATITGVVVNVRAGATVVITAIFTGIPGTYFPLGTTIGTVDILRNGTIIKTVGNNFEASGSGGTAAVSFTCTALQAIDTPGAGTFTYEIETTNGGGVGGVSIVVQELLR